ncbi:MAG: hypothetical protein M3Z83_10690 [Actinomycetota bacterium]|nr:hypothetical protein [Actinomycetota bacterium]
MQRAKRIAGWMLLAFLIYAIVKSPSQAADIIRTAFDIIAQGFRSIFAFFDALLGRK